MRLVWPTLLTIALAVPASPADDAYRAAILKWREQREARLKADDGWLTVAGLFWLHEGGNTLGSAPGNEISLPAGAAPASAGTIEVSGRRGTLQLAPGTAGRV